MEEAFIGTVLIWSIVGAVACAVAGFLMLDPYDRGGIGALVGGLLGPIGLVIAWVLRENAKREADEEERRRRDARREQQNFGFGSGGSQFVGRRRSTRAPAPAADTIDELERLAVLKERGHVTEEEFNARKRVLLGIGDTAARETRA